MDRRKLPNLVLVLVVIVSLLVERAVERPQRCPFQTLSAELPQRHPPRTPSDGRLPPPRPRFSVSLARRPRRRIPRTRRRSRTTSAPTRTGLSARPRCRMQRDDRPAGNFFLRECADRPSRCHRQCSERARGEHPRSAACRSPHRLSDLGSGWIGCRTRSTHMWCGPRAFSTSTPLSWTAGRSPSRIRRPGFRHSP